MMRPNPDWLALVTVLPTGDAPARMRVLRMLEALGAALLRDGVFMLPDSAAAKQGFGKIAEQVNAAQGSAHVLVVKAEDAQALEFAKLFDRSARYADLVKSTESLRTAFGTVDPTALSRTLQKFRREFEMIAALDFFASDAKTRAAAALDHVEEGIRKLLFPGIQGDLTASGRHQLLFPDRSKYFRRVWVTRTPLYADRLASAWLIRRFIDSEAKVFWLDRVKPIPESAVGFGCDGATFANNATQVTYEVLLDAFGLKKDKALARIASIVRSLDVGDTKAPEAAGVQTLLEGAQRRAPDEDSLLRETEKTFDLLYDAYFTV
jgi:hypothetical protein